MENIENVNNLTIETIYKMVLEMKSKLDFLESETHVLQSDKASSFMESIEPKLGNLEVGQVKMQADIESMEPRLGKVETNIERIELRLSKVETDIVKMQADIKSMELRLSKVETEIAEMRRAIVEMKAEQSKLRGDMKAEQSKLRGDMYKWGLALTASIIVSVSSIVSMVVIFAT